MEAEFWKYRSLARR